MAIPSTNHRKPLSLYLVLNMKVLILKKGQVGTLLRFFDTNINSFYYSFSSVEAVNQIYEIKGRKYTSPLAICVGDVQDISRFAVTDHLPLGLLDCLLPGPVTVVLKRGLFLFSFIYIYDTFDLSENLIFFFSLSGESSILEKSLNPGLDTIGVRVPDYDFIRAIARGSQSALALTSANLSGQPSSVDIKDFENLWEHCAYIYNGGVLPAGRAGSTVVNLTEMGKYKILRPGR